MKLPLFILAVAMFFPTLLTYLYFVHLAGSPSGLEKVAFGIGKILQFAIPIACVIFVTKERWFIRRFNRQGVLEGTLFGLTVFVAMLGLYYLLLEVPGAPLGSESKAVTEITGKVRGMGLENRCIFLLFGCFYTVIHSGLEEYYWRWFVFRMIQKMSGKLWLGVVLSSLAFMSHHVILLGTYFGYDSVYCYLGSAGVAIGGAYWCWLYHRADSIWGAWISHGIIDATIFTIGFLILFGME